MWVTIIVGLTGVALVSWRLHSPETCERRFATPARLLCWRLWAYAFWPNLCRRCGLSTLKQFTRRDKDGKQVTSNRWFHPKLLEAAASHTTLRLTVRARMGQTVEELERAVPAIRDAAGAHSARAVVVSPGTLRIELVMREHLQAVGHAAPPTVVATTRVTLGRREDGSAWTLPLSGRHTLTVGCSGSGKGSVFWGIAGGLGPAVRSRTGSSDRH
jgi:S-DNA-T family DNA segregation ATPase FtsK/SpoIIIE